jgi:hypothetical protein
MFTVRRQAGVEKCGPTRRQSTCTVAGTVALSDRVWFVRPPRSTCDARHCLPTRANRVTSEVPRPVADTNNTLRWLNATVPSALPDLRCLSGPENERFRAIAVRSVPNTNGQHHAPRFRVVHVRSFRRASAPFSMASDDVSASLSHRTIGAHARRVIAVRFTDNTYPLRGELLSKTSQVWAFGRPEGDVE